MSCCQNPSSPKCQTKGNQFTPNTVGYILSNNGMERENGILYEKQSFWIAIRDSLEGQSFSCSISLLREKAGENVNPNFQPFDIHSHQQKQGLLRVLADLEIRLHIQPYHEYLLYMEGKGDGTEETLGNPLHKNIFLLQYLRGNEHHYNALIPMNVVKPRSVVGLFSG